MSRDEDRQNQLMVEQVCNRVVDKPRDYLERVLRAALNWERLRSNPKTTRYDLISAEEHLMAVVKAAM